VSTVVQANCLTRKWVLRDFCRSWAIWVWPSF